MATTIQSTHDRLLHHGYLTIVLSLLVLLLVPHPPLYALVVDLCGGSMVVDISSISRPTPASSSNNINRRLPVIQPAVVIASLSLQVPALQTFH
jgi:hypothetical protein